MRRAELLATAQKLRKSDDKYIVRSRNRVIDAWQSERVAGESSQERNIDAYADLEEFIVYDEEDFEPVKPNNRPGKRRRKG